MIVVLEAGGQRGTLTSQLKDGRQASKLAWSRWPRKVFDLVQPSKKASRRNVTGERTSRGPARLDLRGNVTKKAANELDAFIDQALLNNMAADIIHGIEQSHPWILLNTGKRNKHVKSQYSYKMLEAG